MVTQPPLDAGVSASDLEAGTVTQGGAKQWGPRGGKGEHNAGGLGKERVRKRRASRTASGFQPGALGAGVE